MTAATAPECLVSWLTPPAAGGIAVVELRGPGARGVLSRACRTRGGHVPCFEVNRLVYCRLIDEDEVLDDVIAVVRPDAAAEVCLHGGVRVVQRAVLLFERLGAVLREPPSPDVRPADAGAVDALVDWQLPRAATRDSAAWLLRQRRLLPPFLDRLLRGADPPVSSAERAAFVARSRAACRWMRGPRVALVGPPNAGKSTLANALIGRERVVTSALPGTTRDWVDETAMLRGWPITLTDTAGVRPTADPVEAQAIARGLRCAREADAVVLVVDATAAPHAAAAACARLVGLPRPPVVVVNKCDLAPPPPVPAAESLPITAISALRGDNLAELVERLSHALELHLLDDDAPAAFDETLLAVVTGAPA